tara:strand:- start:40237 stop:40701 length:465 start_codon:yes stop_codon:yes gene_type:complete
MVVASCTKETSLDSVSNQASAQGLPDEGSPVPEPPGYDRYWWDNKKIPGVDGTDFGCDYGEGACAQQDYVLTGLMVTEMDGIINEIKLNDPSHTQQVFIDHEIFLKGIFPNNYVNQVISGEVTVKYRGVYVSGQTSYFTFDEAGKIIFVQPIIK